MTNKKTAIILVHGIGEQRPMDTLWSFLDAAWLDDRDLVDPAKGKVVYSKPGGTADNHEMRRVTTRGSRYEDRQFDFYEYYWAHMMRGNTLADVKSWLISLFLRPKSALPPGYSGHWIAGWALTALAMIAYLAWLRWSDTLGWLTGVAVFLVPFPTGLILSKAIPIVGDAARYLRPEPRNVEARQSIRAGGIALVHQLHESGEYDRIVLVGHSLGSLIAYDILTHAWAQVDKGALAAQHAAGSQLMKRLTELETASANLFEPEKVDGRLKPATQCANFQALQSSYRNAQRAYRRALAAQNGPLWLVSDMITLGSPLGKADLLLARSEDEFDRRKDRREFPTCPPVFEYWGQAVKQFSYPRGGSSRIPHHGSPFAPTVWSNVYFPDKLLYLGDPIAGAVSPQFGPGVSDVRLPNRGIRFQHLDYWRAFDDKNGHFTIAALRGALNLRDQNEPVESGNSP